jgi:DNA sulfur modification protein DndC
MDVVDQNGEAILVLGTRKAESNARKKVMNNHEGSTRELLSRNGNSQLDRVWVYPPIGHWTNDDVWEYLTIYPNPWGFENKELLKMYRGATQDNECPLVVDTSTPSCGDSRFGCFVCTLVDKDKSMQAMIKNDEEKRWMLPLSEFRDKYLDTKNDFYKRDFRRMDGRLQLMDDVVTGKKKLVHGPYLQSYREKLLSELLKAQELVRSSGGVTGIELFEVITNEELEEIRRIWVKDKNEIEDRVPQIYTSVTGEPYPFPKIDEGQIFKPENLELLKEVIDKDSSADNLHYQLVRNLLNIERNFSTATRRVGIYEELEKVITNSGFDNEEDALNFALSRISDEDSSNNIEAISEIATQGAMFELINDDQVLDENLNRSQS